LPALDQKKRKQLFFPTKITKPYILIFVQSTTLGFIFLKYFFLPILHPWF